MRTPGTSKMRAIGVTVASLMVLAGCGDSGEVAADTSEISGDTTGEELYGLSCASCHGVDLRGTDLGPSHLSIIYEPNHHTDDSFRSAIANGAPQHHWPFGDMEAITGLSDSNVESIITYVRSVQEAEGFEQ